MRIKIFSSKSYDRSFLEAANGGRHELEFLEPRLDESTAPIAAGADAVCVFVNDTLNEAVIDQLKEAGVRLIALRCAGFNNVDLAASAKAGLTVCRVPAYSPSAVAEHTLALILALNRRLPRAHNRVRDGNFSLEGLLGFDLSGKTAGVVGVGHIGSLAVRILLGFGCRVLFHDAVAKPEMEEMGAVPGSMEELFRQSDILTLHCPLTPETRHMINRDSIETMKTGVMVINTSRGGLVDTKAVIEGLKSGKIGNLGLDVYEEETALFFEDRSHGVIQDDVFSRLLTFPNVLITGHQGFFTREALESIARTTMENVDEFEKTGACSNAVELA